MKKTILLTSLVVASIANGQIVFAPSALTVAPVSGTPNLYSVNGTFTDTANGASGTWSISIEDTAAAGTPAFLNTSVVNFASVGDGQGVQLVLDSNVGETANAWDINFSYTVTNGTLDPTAGAAFAIGPFGGGNQDHNGGSIGIGGVLFDDPGTAAQNVSSLNYDPLTGLFNPTPDPGSAGVSANHNSTVLFTGNTSLNYVGAAQQTDTFVFGIAANPIPEPSSTALLGLGGLTLLARRRR